MFRIEYISGAPKLARRAGRLAGKLRNLKPALTASRQFIGRGVIEGFEAGTDPEGRPWRKSKKRRGKTLVKRGRLAGSIDVKAGRDSLTQFSDLGYSYIHQLGGKAGVGRKTTTPKRRFLGFTDAMREHIRKRIHEYLSRP